MKDSPAQRAGRAAFHAHMIKKLAKKPWIADYREGVIVVRPPSLLKKIQMYLVVSDKKSSVSGPFVCL